MDVNTLPAKPKIAVRGTIKTPLIMVDIIIRRKDVRFKPNAIIRLVVTGEIVPKKPSIESQART